jgi:hypothetical protein
MNFVGRSPGAVDNYFFSASKLDSPLAGEPRPAEREPHDARVRTVDQLGCGDVHRPLRQLAARSQFLSHMRANPQIPVSSLAAR